MSDHLERNEKLPIPCNIDEEFEIACEIDTLWRKDRSSCEEALAELLQCRPPNPEVIEEIILVSINLADQDFDDVLYSISKRSGIATLAKQTLSMFLVSRGHKQAVDNFEKSFSSACKKFLNGKLDEVALSVNVKQACILKKAALHVQLGETLRLYHEAKGSQPYLHITIREQVETLYCSLRDGIDYAFEILSGKESTDKQEAAVFMLGCEQNPDWFDTLNDVYCSRLEGDEFPIRRECVNSIVYSCHSNNILDFLTKNIEKERKGNSKSIGIRWPWTADRRGDILRLLLAATYCPAINARLESELRNWLDLEEPRYAVFAYLALEKHGKTDTGFEKKNKKEIDSERSFRRNRFHYCDLLRSRGLYSGLREAKS